MDFKKEFIIQAVKKAADNLRLTTEKIQIVNLLKEMIDDAEDTELLITNLKSVTEFSKFAIKLGNCYKFISCNKIDYIHISDRFKEQSAALLRDLSILLDVLTVERLSEIIEEMNRKKSKPEESRDDNQTSDEELKKEIIFEENTGNVEFDFENFEKKILAPIKILDSFIERLKMNSYSEDELIKYEQIMIENGRLSKEAGFSILYDMHNIFAQGLKLILYKELIPVNPVIEGLRACLIVIVAVVRNKDVDITKYHERAEDFGKEIMYNFGKDI